jgi:hypothetical protein
MDNKYKEIEPRRFVNRREAGRCVVSDGYLWFGTIKTDVVAQGLTRVITVATVIHANHV